MSARRVLAIAGAVALVIVAGRTPSAAQTPSPQTAAMGRSWDDAYRGSPAFNAEPNAFLMAVAQGLTPGTALQQRAVEFDWGADRWDLIVLAYFPGLRTSLPSILQSLRSGGHVLVEAYQSDAALDMPPGPGPGVTFGDNELLTVFSTLRVIRYEDLRARADWGMRETRLVRLLARKR